MLPGCKKRRGKVIQKIAFMPIFFQQDINGDTKLAIWKIEEEEAFFQVPLQRSITHPHKRLQHLAGRYLLRYLFPEFPLSLIRIADTRKPYLPDEAFHFSISHCGDFAAVIVSRSSRVGIDIELVDEKVRRIQHKFLTQVEQETLLTPFRQDTELLTLLWSSKEAVFKWFGAGGVDFREHIGLEQLRETGEGAYELQARFTKAGAVAMLLQAVFFQNLCCCYVVTEGN